MDPWEGDRGSLVVASDHRLVGEALGAALESRGFRSLLLPGWPPANSAVPVPFPRRVERPWLLLLVCELEATGRVRQARAVSRSRSLPWLVLSSSGRGPAWGAMVEAGAAGVLGSDLSLDELVRAIETVRAGGSPTSEVERQDLVRRWRSATRVAEPLRRHVESLTVEESEMLSLLYEGGTVKAIAERYGVSEAAARRQIQSVLRRLARGSLP